jgi:hypothetical protein
MISALMSRLVECARSVLAPWAVLAVAAAPKRVCRMGLVCCSSGSTRPSQMHKWGVLWEDKLGGSPESTGRGVMKFRIHAQVDGGVGAWQR